MTSAMGTEGGNHSVPQEGTDGDERKFRRMFERTADATLLLDTGANLFVEYNQATLDMLKCTSSELSSLHPSALSPPTQPDGRDSFDKANEMIAIAIREGSNRFEWTHRSPWRDDFPVEVLLTPVSRGASPIIMVVWRDITDRKRSEEALRQAQRLESVAVLAGGIAHDFNNLLAAIAGHVELARVSLREPVERATAVHHLDTIDRAVSRAADLTRQMLAYSGRGQLWVEQVDLGAMTRETVELFRVSASSQVAIECQLPTEPLVIEGDRAQMQQVLMNLFTNAAEAIGDAPGTISMRASRATLDEEDVRRDFTGQDVAAGNKIVLEVVDTGRGMSPEVLTRIFDPFFSTKQSGRGLGLAALRGILKTHHAGFCIDSKVGRGTTFRIFYPAASVPTTAPEPELPAVSRPVTTGGAVLLVDDQANVRASLGALLRHLGFTVLEAIDGLDAVNVFRRNRERIGWVLMDLTMPVMDGRSAFLELKALDPDVVVILSSGWTEADAATHFTQGGPAAMLPKPFTLPVLQATLARLGLISPNREQNPG